MFLIGLATHCSPAAERYFLLVLYLAMLVIIVLAMRRASATKHYAWLCVPLSLMVFSVRQNENMLNGFQIMFVATAALLLASFFAVATLTEDRHWKHKFAMALVLGA